MLISLDTETTGKDFYHGSLPFFVTMCEEGKSPMFWEWDVDPLTRKVLVPKGDIREIQRIIDKADHLVLHNAKFDCTSLEKVGIRFPWEKVHDTLIASHLLASKLPHDLTALGVQYLGIDITKYEKALEEVVNKARRVVRKYLPNWKIAIEGMHGLPSATGTDKLWKNDYWLPKAAFDSKELQDRADDRVTADWETVLADYSNIDSEMTIKLWAVLKEEIERRGLWEIYLARLKVLPVAYRMEKYGVTINKKRLKQQVREYQEYSEEAAAVCVGIAESFGYDLDLPKSGRSKSLDVFAFDVLKLPVLERSEKTDRPVFTKEVKDHYEQILPAYSKEKRFIRNLNSKAKRDTALSFMRGYQRFWNEEEGDMCRLHPGTNPTGTDTLRWSFSNPNEANISKREGFNLRYSFGPKPGRVWVSADAVNIELRIPAYESGEKDLIEIFDHPEQAPYYGSYHLVVFDALHPDLFREHGKNCKVLFESTWYQWVKNGDFSLIYGAQEETADRTFHVTGAYKKIKHRFPRMSALSDRQIELANRLGYVETLPDITVNPNKGYPLMCSRNRWGVSPTVPLNYHVSGSAMWWMGQAMVRCDELLERWREEDYDGHLIMQVHDELVFDLPDDDTIKDRAYEIKKTMEIGGSHIGVPTPVSLELHRDNWSVGVAI